MKLRKRFLAICLCLTMALPFAACGSKESSNDGQPKKDYVYTAEFQKVSGVDSLSNSAIQGDKMYYSSWNYNEETEESSYQTFVMDLKTLESTLLNWKLADNENIIRMTVAKEGDIVCLLNQWAESWRYLTRRAARNPDWM